MSVARLKVVFMGTPAFSLPALEALHATHDIIAVYCQPPRPAGRGQQPQPCPVEARACALGLQVRHPVTLRDAQVQADFAALQADVAVVVAYGLILPPEVLAAPRLGCLNIHASVLPRWRGAAPLHRAVLAGDPETGVCIMQMDAGLDTGPVLSCIADPIGPADTTADLHDRLAKLGGQMIVQALADLPHLSAVPQSDIGVSYAAKIEKSEARIDWALPAVVVDRQIRGLSPFPGAWCMVGDTRVKLLRSTVLADDLGNTAPRPGTLLANGAIACGQGAVHIMLAQRAGKKPLPADDVWRGLGLDPGDCLA